MFIPDQDTLKYGDWVELTKNVRVNGGTFTIGHVFMCIGEGERGYNFIDSEDRKLLETLMEGTFYKKL